MLGLRPRLKTRPSLLDLIAKRDIDHLSSKAPVSKEQKPTAGEVPLPESPPLHQTAPPLLVIENVDTEPETSAEYTIETMPGVSGTQCGAAGAWS